MPAGHGRLRAQWDGRPEGGRWGVGGVVLVDGEWREMARASEPNPWVGVGGSNLAYVIYTSGSTGVPKGVAIAHRSAVALLEWSKTTFEEEGRAGILASTSICFDLSV